MNDLMTNSFQNYVELKKQAALDEEQQHSHHHKNNRESTNTAAAAKTTTTTSSNRLDPENEQNLTLIFQEAERIKTQMTSLATLLHELQSLHEETKLTHSLKLLEEKRDKMCSKTITLLRTATSIKSSIISMDESNTEEGTVAERTRTTVTNGLRVRLKETMNEFSKLRDRINVEQKEELRREYYNANGEWPGEETMEKLVSGKMRIEMVERVLVGGCNKKDKKVVVSDVKRSLERLQQVFFDMAVLVEGQRDQVDDIEKNVARAGEFVSCGMKNLGYADMEKKKGRRRWVLFMAIVLVLVVVMVCIVVALTR